MPTPRPRLTGEGPTRSKRFPIRTIVGAEPIPCSGGRASARPVALPGELFSSVGTWRDGRFYEGSNPSNRRSRRRRPRLCLEGGAPRRACFLAHARSARRRTIRSAVRSARPQRATPRTLVPTDPRTRSPSRPRLEDGSSRTSPLRPGVAEAVVQGLEPVFRVDDRDRQRSAVALASSRSSRWKSCAGSAAQSADPWPPRSSPPVRFANGARAGRHPGATRRSAGPRPRW